MAIRAKGGSLMAELSFHDVVWCPWHGHPVLVLAIDDSDRYIALTLTETDARALSPVPSVSGSSRPRLHGVLPSLLAGLDARLREVQLVVGGDGLLRSSLTVEGPRGLLTLPAHTSDGVLLARQMGVPLRMAAEDLAHAGDAVGYGPLARVERADSPNGAGDTLAPFRQFIASLDLDDHLERGEHAGGADERRVP